MNWRCCKNSFDTDTGPKSDPEPIVDSWPGIERIFVTTPYKAEILSPMGNEKTLERALKSTQAEFYNTLLESAL
jgi:hypothetical protein